MSAADTLIAGAQVPYTRPRGTLEVLLVRHGAYARGDDPGANDRLGGIADPPLNGLGRRQAQKIADRLEHVPFAAAFTSPLQRTAQSAAPLLDRLGRTAAVIDDLREIHLGIYDGQEFENQRAAGNPLIAEIFARQRWDLVPESEPMDAFGDRVRRGLESIAEVSGPDTTSLAFVHAGVVAELCAQITRSRRMAFIAAENASITTVLRHASGTWELRSFNDTSHLQ